jgi:hypothetical protein
MQRRLKMANKKIQTNHSKNLSAKSSAIEIYLNLLLVLSLKKDFFIQNKKSIL